MVDFRSVQKTGDSVGDVMLNLKLMVGHHLKLWMITFIFQKPFNLISGSLKPKNESSAHFSCRCYVGYFNPPEAHRYLCVRLYEGKGRTRVLPFYILLKLYSTVHYIQMMTCWKDTSHLVAIYWKQWSWKEAARGLSTRRSSEADDRSRLCALMWLCVNLGLKN